MRQKLLPIGFGLALAAFAAVLLIPGAAIIHAQQLPPQGQYLSPGQLDDLVAPIALYPDPLISQTLVAVTYPLEVVEASQWQQRNPNLSGPALTQAVARQDWDPSVQALVAFPDVLKYLTEDIAWTTSLGNAFLAQEADVMDAIQRMRAKAAQAGKLTTTSQQQVTRTYDAGQPVYVIVPRDPDIIYVPVYDPFWIWGAPAYYPYARWYYPQSFSGLYFSRGISLQFVFGPSWQGYGWQGWNDWGWRPGWNTRTVIVNNTFISRQNFNSAHLSNRTGTASWSHDATHRQGVPYPTAAMTERFRGGNRDNVRPRELQGRDREAAVAPRQVSPATAPSQLRAAPQVQPQSRPTQAVRGESQFQRSPRPVQPGGVESLVQPAPRRTPTVRDESQFQPSPRPVQPGRVESLVQPAPRPAQSQPAQARSPVQSFVREQQPSRSVAPSQHADAPSHEPAGSRDSGGGDRSRGRR